MQVCLFCASARHLILSAAAASVASVVVAVAVAVAAAISSTRRQMKEFETCDAMTEVTFEELVSLMVDREKEMEQNANQKGIE